MNERLNRRDFLKALSASSAACAFMGCAGKQIPSKQQPFKGKPNIIFIMTDDHAAHALSCYGSKINKTPNLDRLAQEGMIFRNCFCTNSICAPSRAVILTGKHSHINGVLDNRLPFDANQQTFPKLLQKNGYQTAMIGKWHLKSNPTGFDYWNILPGQGVYYNPEMIEMGQRKKYTGYVTDIITDHALNWLKKASTKQQPFCLLYQHKAPHRRWLPGPKHLNMYDDVTIPEPETLFDDYRTRCDAARQQEMSVAHNLDSKDLKLETPPGLNPDQLKLWQAAYGPKNEAFKKANLTGRELIKWKYQRYIKDYLRCIASVDDNVGRVLDYLDESGLAANTVVVYTADQGFYLGDHGWFDKRFMYKESFRMPFIVRYPQMIKPGSVNNDLVQNLDFAPTLLDLAHAPIPPDIQGRSMRELLEGKTPQDWPDSLYYHYYEFPAVHMVKRHYGIRTKRYKLIHFYYDIDAWELYDLEKDPHELNNIYADPTYAPIVKKLKTKLQKLRQHFGDSDQLTQKFLQQYLEQHKKRLKK